MADRQLEQRRDLTRKQKRYIRREVRSQMYAKAARNGGGAQERDRRMFQIVTGAILSDNGVV